MEQSTNKKLFKVFKTFLAWNSFSRYPFFIFVFYSKEEMHLHGGLNEGHFTDKTMTKFESTTSIAALLHIAAPTNISFRMSLYCE